MELVFPVSENLDVIGYGLGPIACEGMSDPLAPALFIRFKRGGCYRYDGANDTTFAALCGAESVGKHFHAFIRDKFPTSKLSTDFVVQAWTKACAA